MKCESFAWEERRTEEGLCERGCWGRRDGWRRREFKTKGKEGERCKNELKRVEREGKERRGRRRLRREKRRGSGGRKIVKRRKGKQEERKWLEI